jgi:hypothetical protein
VTLDADLQELRRVRRVQQIFATPAAIWEEIADECNGECAHPRMVSPSLSCCACKHLHDLVVDASKLEKVVRQRIERDTGQKLRVNLKTTAREGLALKQFSPRTHSPTHVGRMKGEDAERLKQLREQFKDEDDESSKKKGGH